MSVITIEDMVEAAERELAMRRGVYPRWVAAGRLKQEKADHELAAMAAIVGHLKAERDEWKPCKPIPVGETFGTGVDMLFACLNEETRRPYMRFFPQGHRLPPLAEVYASRPAPALPAPPSAPPTQGSLL